MPHLKNKKKRTVDCAATSLPYTRQIQNRSDVIKTYRNPRATKATVLLNSGQSPSETYVRTLCEGAHVV